MYARRDEKNDGRYGLDKAISVANMRFNPSATTRDDDYLHTYNVMWIGDIALEGNRSKLFAHGRFVENDIGDGIVSHVFDVLKPISPRWPRPPSWQPAERDHGCDGLDEERILEVLRDDLWEPSSAGEVGRCNLSIDIMSRIAWELDVEIRELF